MASTPSRPLRLHPPLAPMGIPQQLAARRAAVQQSHAAKRPVLPRAPGVWRILEDESDGLHLPGFAARILLHHTWGPARIPPGAEAPHGTLNAPSGASGGPDVARSGILREAALACANDKNRDGSPASITTLLSKVNLPYEIDLRILGAHIWSRYTPNLERKKP